MQKQSQTSIQKSGIIQPQKGNSLCKYTIIPIQDSDHRQKLQKFINTRGKIKLKSSLCRFYLRGICIMKPQFCKFAHSISQLSLDVGEGLFYMTMSDKQRKKRQFVEKKQFNQTALFILKHVKYHVLYEYQFGERFKKSGIAVHDIDTISKDRSVRIRIREIMHRQIWDGFLNFLQTKFPQANYPISFVSFWYANFGFDKPQTRCKFGDFLKYSMHVKKYIQVDIIFPPNLFPSIYLINGNQKETILQQNAGFLYQNCMKQKQKQGKDKMQQFLQKGLPEQLSKKYICRYFMAGNCQSSSTQCLYAHSIQQLKQAYELGQQFPIQYRQPVIPIEVRMNFTSLYEATRKFRQYADYSLQDINLNSSIRNQLREKVHYQLFDNFLKLLQQMLSQNKKEQFFSIQLKQLQKYYQGAGFNHTNQNKFQHLEGSLWDLGFYMQDKVIKDQVTLQKKKCTYVYKIPPLQYLNQIYRKTIQQCVGSQLKTLSQNGVLLQSALKRTIYSYQKQGQSVLPLHVYLRFRSCSFQEVANQFCSKQQIDRIYFQSGEQNIKKIGQFIKKYLKKNKNYITKLDEIENHIKSQKKNEINTNHFVNLRNVIQSVIIELGKLIFFWPFDNNAFVVDPNNLTTYKKNVLQPKLKLKQKDQTLQEFKAKCSSQQISQFVNQRIIIVDSQTTLVYASKYLKSCAKIGVDLQGRLRIDGFVDLIQISGAKRNKNSEIQHKQIFIFDIFSMKNRNKTDQVREMPVQQTQKKVQQCFLVNKNCQKQGDSKNSIYAKTLQFLRQIFENRNKLKILHDCRQDSIALKYVMGISIENVFDTSGFDLYLNQKSIYEEDKHLNTGSLVRKIYDVKIQGLNNILDTYKAPNGVNIFKDSMKKKFGQPNSRSYFQQRPIDQQFLQYSARDVQDLIQVQQNMSQSDEHLLSSFIGQLYSKC